MHDDKQIYLKINFHSPFGELSGVWNQNKCFILCAYRYVSSRSTSLESHLGDNNKYLVLLVWQIEFPSRVSGHVPITRESCKIKEKHLLKFLANNKFIYSRISFAPALNALYADGECLLITAIYKCKIYFLQNFAFSFLCVLQVHF